MVRPDKKIFTNFSLFPSFVLYLSIQMILLHEVNSQVFVRKNRELKNLAKIIFIMVLL